MKKTAPVGAVFPVYTLQYSVLYSVLCTRSLEYAECSTEVPRLHVGTRRGGIGIVPA